MWFNNSQWVGIYATKPIHNHIVQAAQHHPVGVLFCIGAVAAMAIQTGAMYKLIRPFVLIATVIAAGYGAYAIYFSGSVGTFIIGMIVCGFGFWLGDYFLMTAREAWYPETVLKKYGKVPALPDLKSLSKEQLEKEYICLHRLATEQEKKLKSKSAENSEEDTEEDESSSGINIKLG